jgi:hypothetical protein
LLVWDDSAVLEFTMYTEFTTRVHNVRSVNSLALLTTCDLEKYLKQVTWRT